MPTLTETTDAAASTATTYSMSVGDYFHGEIAGGADTSDWIRVDLVAGQQYTIALAGLGALTDNLRDTYLRIRDSGGTLVFENDDISTGDGYYYSTVTFTAGSTGSFYVDVQSWTNTFTGDYGVSVVEGARASYDAEMGAGMLLNPNAAWTTTPGTDATVSWAIRASGTEPAGGNPFIAPSAAQVGAISSIMAYLDALSGLTLNQVNPGGTSNSATMLFGAYDDSTDGAGAYAFYPDSWGGGTPDTGFGANAGDVWLNNDSVSTSSLPFGSYSHFAIMHEIGHAIGLAHPGPYNAGPGVVITYANDAEFTEDSHQYTVMSYFDETETGASAGLNYPDTFMLFDLLALHQLYGVDAGYMAGDTTYGFNATAALAGTAYDYTVNTDPLLSVYDGSGTDTIDLSGYAMAQALSLVQGAFSDIGGFVGNFSIAYGAVIENAVGGSGNDTITGNDVANSIAGGSGDDTLQGGNGSDTLHGGTGNDALHGGNHDDVMDGGRDNDTLWGGFGNDVMVGGFQEDHLYGEDGDDRMYGNAGFDWMEGGAGNDTLDGGDQADNLLGNAGNDVLLGGNGFDRLFGQEGDDRAYGGNGPDALFGQEGNDRLYGQDGNDRFWGGIGNDVLDGGAGDDLIQGGAGFDTLIGSTGNDRLTGNFNADLFVFTDFGGGFGHDTVVDFEATNDLEKLDLSRVSGISDFADLVANHMYQDGTTVRIEDGKGNSIRLLNVDLNDLLDGNDFIL